MRQSRFLVVLVGLSLAGCVTSRLEDDREKVTGLGEDQSVVIMTKSYHTGNETEGDYLTCIEKALASGSKGIRVVPHQEFVDQLFPWFEPRTAPADTKGLPTLLGRPGVSKAIEDMGVRYVVWLDGDTERVAGFAWWQNDADYEAAVWDMEGRESAGTVSADVSGTSFLPALVVPIPLIARTQTRACKGLAQQLRAFIVQ